MWQNYDKEENKYTIIQPAFSCHIFKFFAEGDE